MLSLHADGSLIASLSLRGSVFGVVGAVNSTMGPGTKLVLGTVFVAVSSPRNASDLVSMMSILQVVSDISFIEMLEEADDRTR